MSTIRCVRRAAAAGRLSRQDRARLEHIYGIALADAEVRFAGRRGVGALAENEANKAFDRTLTLLAQERGRAAQLQAEAEDRLLADAARFLDDKGEPDIGEYGLRLVNQLHFEAQTLFQMDQLDLGALIHEFRRRPISGLRHGQRHKIGPLEFGSTRAEHWVDEVYGDASGDPVAARLAAATQAVLRRKVEQFNAAGGILTARDKYFPVHHDALQVVNAGYERWSAAIKQRIDPEQMINALTGRPFKPRELDEALREVFDAFQQMGFGAADQFGAGPTGAEMWRSRMDPRFFVFKSSADWRAYHAEFGGSQNPFEVFTSYLRSIDHDIASMQRLGPNPEATMARLAGTRKAPGGWIMEEMAKANAGRAALFPAHRGILDPTKKMAVPAFKHPRERVQHAVNKARGTLDAWEQFTGAAKRPFNPYAAQIVGDVNNVLYANMLAFTPLLTVNDFVNQAATRAFNSVSVTGMMRDMVDALRLSTDREALVELGIEVDTGLSVMTVEAREQAIVQGAVWSRGLVDRTFTYTGLKPITMGARAMWTLGVLREVTRHQRTAYAKLPANFRDLLARYDIDAGAWEFIQAAPVTDNRGVSVIRPGDLASVDIFTLTAGRGGIGESVQPRPGLSRGEEVAARLMRMIKEEGEFATISGTPRSARLLRHEPGSIPGFYFGSIAKLKTYTISHFQHHGFRAAKVFRRNGGGLRGTGQAGLYYFGSLLLPGMFLVAVGTIIQDLLSGREAPDVTDPAFAGRVAAKTVSLGFADELFRRAMDPEGSFASRASSIGGPAVSATGDVVDLGVGALQEGYNAATGGEDDIRLGRRAVRTTRNFVPRHWATDLAVERLIWDNLQRAVDPEAEEDFARRAQRPEQGMWWAPGEALPQRGPDLSTLDPADEDADLGGVR